MITLRHSSIYKWPYDPYNCKVVNGVVQWLLSLERFGTVCDPLLYAFHLQRFATKYWRLKKKIQNCYQNHSICKNNQGLSWAFLRWTILGIITINLKNFLLSLVLPFLTCRLFVISFFICISYNSKNVFVFQRGTSLSSSKVKVTFACFLFLTIALLSLYHLVSRKTNSDNCVTVIISLRI